MTLHILDKRLVFNGKFDEKLTAIMILKNVDERKKLAIKFSSNVYHERISVKPKKALLDPFDEVTATFKYRPSRPQGRDRIRISSAPMASSIVNLTNFESVWNQSEAFQQIDTTYIDIIHVEVDGRVVTFAPEVEERQCSPSVDFNSQDPGDQLNDAYLMDEENVVTNDNDKNDGDNCWGAAWNDGGNAEENANNDDGNGWGAAWNDGANTVENANNDDGNDWGADWAADDAAVPDENNNHEVIDENNNMMTDAFHQANDEWAPATNEAPEVVGGHLAVNEWNQAADEQLGGQPAEEWAAVEDGNVNHQGNFLNDQGAVASWGQENIYANHDVAVDNPCGQEAPFDAQGTDRVNSQWPADQVGWGGTGDVAGALHRDFTPEQGNPVAYSRAAPQLEGSNMLFDFLLVFTAILVFGILIGKGLA